MCLKMSKYYKRRMKEALDRWPEDQPNKVYYKVYLKIEGAYLLSPYQKYNYCDPGIICSNRIDKALFRSLDDDEMLTYREVYRGIHVFTYKSDAKKFVDAFKASSFIRHIYRQYDQNLKPVIVPVVCHRDDLVAVGKTSGTDSDELKSRVFMKVEITKETWEEIFKEQ